MDLNTAPIFIVNESNIQAGDGESTLWLGKTPLLSSQVDQVAFVDLVELAAALGDAQYLSQDANKQEAQKDMPTPVLEVDIATLAAEVSHETPTPDDYARVRDMTHEEQQELINTYLYSNTQIYAALIAKHGSLAQAVEEADMLVAPDAPEGE